MKNIVFNIDEAKAVLGLTTSSVEAEEKMADAVETKAANDVMHTQNVGHGKELVQFCVAFFPSWLSRYKPSI